MGAGAFFIKPDEAIRGPFSGEREIAALVRGHQGIPPTAAQGDGVGAG